MIIIGLFALWVVCLVFIAGILKRLDLQDSKINEIYTLVMDSEERFSSESNIKESLIQIIKKSPLNTKKNVFIPSKDVDYVMSGKLTDVFDGKDDDMFS